MSPTDFVARRDADAPVLDVRTPAEFDEGHLAGADAIVAAGGFVSASSVVDPSSAPGEWEAAVIDLFQNDDVTVRYDATELMPTSAAGEALAAGVTSWVDGAVTTDVLEDIEAEVGG